MHSRIPRANFTIRCPETKNVGIETTQTACSCCYGIDNPSSGRRDGETQRKGCGLVRDVKIFYYAKKNAGTRIYSFNSIRQSWSFCTSSIYNYLEKFSLPSEKLNNFNSLQEKCHETNDEKFTRENSFDSVFPNNQHKVLFGAFRIENVCISKTNSWFSTYLPNAIFTSSPAKC